MQHATRPRRPARTARSAAARRPGRRSHRYAAWNELAGRVWELRHNVTPYDAAYLALAEARGCRLVTTHGKLRDCPGRRCDVHVVTPGR